MDNNNIDKNKVSPVHEIQIELPDDVAQGIYANLSVITHSTSEFVIDFIRLVPNVSKAKVQSRVILTPENAKRLLYALEENIGKYEEASGYINLERFIPPMGGIKGEA
ncbi:MAG: DUF3467 domain-containing protein [Tannerellaceae bacterium]|jgi:hypothetical protein|nr:DUF3467 domain-containing protein [Tannerellaceae bacterium]